MPARRLGDIETVARRMEPEPVDAVEHLVDTRSPHGRHRKCDARALQWTRLAHVALRSERRERAEYEGERCQHGGSSHHGDHRAAKATPVLRPPSFHTEEAAFPAT